MQTRNSIVVTVLFALTAQPALSSDIPVKQVVLYKHGIAFFEREGSVPAGEEARLDFKSTDMNDILKSLTVNEEGGGHISGVRYDSNESLDQQLSTYPFKLGDQERLSTLLDGMKGAHIELKYGDGPIKGQIIGARSIEADKKIVREQITLLLDSGDVANYNLDTVTSLRLLDPRLQEQLKQYLRAVAQSRAKDIRSVYIDSSGTGTRELRVSYISPTAIWKSSYRLTLGAASMLEGWAIVDNTTADDWNNVKLAVVSGRPISFISLLDTPRYGQRQVAELPEDRAAGPVVYAGGMEASVDGGVIGDSLARVPPAAPPPPQQAPAARRKSALNYVPGAGLTLQHQPQDTNGFFTKTQPSSVEGATGETLGELFEYSFATPITIKKNQSAMLPFLQDKVEARKLLIYNNSGSEHPVNAAEISNSTGKTLDGGPITVYDGGAYAGEALVETLKAGDKRLIGYAVDYGTRITEEYGSGQQNIREIHANNGLLHIRYSERDTRTYTVHNVDAKPKTLIVEQADQSGYTVLSPKPSERTAKADRFELKVAANGNQILKVDQEHVTFDAVSVSDAAPNWIVSVLVNKELSERGKTQLQAVSDAKQHLVETNSALADARSQSEDLTRDQTRLRQNIDSLNRVKGQEDLVRKYSGQLSDNEAQLSKLRDQMRDLEQRKATLEKQQRELIQKLDF
ncbi:MAG TPA: hypothetical protein VH325_04145 [Bryobacteraceae bacterium]|jgi:hypothetical protein|nr:hypothetical protein [Bryobacteraceae bacterium]